MISSSLKLLILWFSLQSISSDEVTLPLALEQKKTTPEVPPQIDPFEQKKFEG